jgi:hypothetical protein
MGLLRGAAWTFGIIFFLFGLAYIAATLYNRDGESATRIIIGVFAIFIGMLLCYAGKKLRGREDDDDDNNSSAHRDESDDDSGSRPWWKPDPKYHGAFIDQTQRRLGWKN